MGAWSASDPLGRRGGLVALAGMLFFVLACGSSSSTPQVTAPSGALKGTKLTSGAEAFLGVPYAKPPVGDLRFRVPVPVDTWDGVLDATAMKGACSQLANNDSPKIVNEDCLYLNVYRPAGTAAGAKLPVYFYIHGGGYTSGTGGDYDGSKIALTNGMVVVMVDYRVNAFGFMATPELTHEQGITGNYGLLDQVEAMRWVKKNIDAFGGDPGNVTISGQSAGAMSVCDQVASPLAAGLFHKAIMQSGVCQSDSISNAYTYTAPFVQHLGCTGTEAEVLSCLRSKSAAEILDATASSGSYGGWRMLGPVVDGSYLKKSQLDAFSSGEFNHVPMLIGNVHDEWTGFAYGMAFTATSSPAAVTDQATFEAWAGKLTSAKLDLVKASYHVSDFAKPIYALGALVNDSGALITIASCPQRRLAKTLSDALAPYGLALYDYEFNDRTMPEQRSLGTDGPATDKSKFLDPTISLGAYHAGDLKYTIGFDTLTELSPAQLVLSDEIVKYWGAFARTGDPNVAGQAAWKPYATAREVMSFELPHSKLETDAAFDADHRCTAVWDAN